MDTLDEDPRCDDRGKENVVCNDNQDSITSVASLLTSLYREFPALRAFVPLALRIDLPPCDAARGASYRVRRRALARHCRRRRYLEAVAPGGPRYALDGSVCGEVSKLQRSAAKARLEAITEAASRKPARLAKPRRQP